MYKETLRHALLYYHQICGSLRFAGWSSNPITGLCFNSVHRYIEPSRRPYDPPLGTYEFEPDSAPGRASDSEDDSDSGLSIYSYVPTVLPAIIERGNVRSSLEKAHRSADDPKCLCDFTESNPDPIQATDISPENSMEGPSRDLWNIRMQPFPATFTPAAAYIPVPTTSIVQNESGPTAPTSASASFPYPVPQPPVTEVSSTAPDVVRRVVETGA